MEVEIGELDHRSDEDVERSTLERDLVDRAMRGLDEDERVIVVLYYYLDLSLAEVAATLGIPEGTAKSRLFRARRDLRRAIGIEDVAPTQELAGELR
jgi:RNA polymerase sigma-70 factor (ECF subfamily)